MVLVAGLHRDIEPVHIEVTAGVTGIALGIADNPDEDAPVVGADCRFDDRTAAEAVDGHVDRDAGPVEGLHQDVVGVGVGARLGAGRGAVEVDIDPRIRGLGNIGLIGRDGTGCEQREEGRNQREDSSMIHCATWRRRGWLEVLCSAMAQALLSKKVSQGRGSKPAAPET